MTRIGFVAAFLLIGTVAASAALPPYWQRKAEIDAITDSSDVARRLEIHGPIDMIEHVGNDHYRVGGGGCTLDVFIVDDSERRTDAGTAQVQAADGQARLQMSRPAAAPAAGAAVEWHQRSAHRQIGRLTAR